MTHIIISQAIRDFYVCQTAERGNLIAMINPTLLRRAWELYKQEGAGFSGYSLIQDWNSATNGAPFDETSVKKYLEVHGLKSCGTKRQQQVAESVRSVLATLPPSYNKKGGTLNAALINLAWKLLDSEPNLAPDEFNATLLQKAQLAVSTPESVKYKKPLPYIIPHQKELGAAVKAAIKHLKDNRLLPVGNSHVSTQLAGVINAVAWRLDKLGKCTKEAIVTFVEGKTILEIKQALASA